MFDPFSLLRSDTILINGQPGPASVKNVGLTRRGPELVPDGLGNAAAQGDLSVEIGVDHPQFAKVSLSSPLVYLGEAYSLSLVTPGTNPGGGAVKYLSAFLAPPDDAATADQTTGQRKTYWPADAPQS